jgi:[ribosomal protein S5]-alanine N-acetyltransferase
LGEYRTACAAADQVLARHIGSLDAADALQPAASTPAGTACIMHESPKKAASMNPPVTLREAVLADERRFLALARASETLHRPWVAAPATAAQFRAYLQRMHGDSNHAFLVCRRDDGDIAGVVNLTHIVLGAFRSGYLGYYAFAGYERQGCMRAGLRALIRHAFQSLRLHRLEANIQPGNTASIALVKSCGFSLEGYSPRYLKIRGRWRDHERWAILAR